MKNPCTWLVTFVELRSITYILMIGPAQSWIQIAEGGRDLMLRYPLIGHSCTSAWSLNVLGHHQQMVVQTWHMRHQMFDTFALLECLALPVISFCDPTSSSTCVVVSSLCTTSAMMKLRPSKRILSTTDLEPFAIFSNRNVESAKMPIFPDQLISCS
jgi:hypothetical protein